MTPKCSLDEVLIINMTVAHLFFYRSILMRLFYKLFVERYCTSLLKDY